MTNDIVGLAHLNDQVQAALRAATVNSDPVVISLAKSVESVLPNQSIAIQATLSSKESRFLEARGYHEQAAKSWQKSLANLNNIVGNYRYLTDTELAKSMYGFFALSFEQQQAFAKVAESSHYQASGQLKKAIGALQGAEKILRDAVAMPMPPSDLTKGVRIALGALRDFVTKTLRSHEEAMSTLKFMPPYGEKVLIIHGHDEAKWRELQDLLEKEFELDVVILWLEDSLGKTVIEKFESAASECCYAFAMMTPDDMVYDEATKRHQARPNVFFELGWFAGRFGRGRVTILKKEATSIPSDLLGVIHLDFIDRVGERYQEIRNTLEASGVIDKRQPASRRPSRSQKDRRRSLFPDG